MITMAMGSLDTVGLQTSYFTLETDTADAQVFNIIPVSPLDGSQIFSGLLIRTNPDLVRNLQIYGPQILLGAILIGYFTPISPISWIMRPFVNFFLFLFAGI